MMAPTYIAERKCHFSRNLNAREQLTHAHMRQMLVYGTCSYMARTHSMEISAMAVARERVAILMSPEDKSAIEAKALAMGVSVGEFLRRSAAAYDPDADTTHIALLLQALTASHTETLKALDDAERELAETRRYFASKRKVASRPF
jgi:hypothetical protein